MSKNTPTCSADDVLKLCRFASILDLEVGYCARVAYPDDVTQLFAAEDFKLFELCVGKPPSSSIVCQYRCDECVEDNCYFNN